MYLSNIKLWNYRKFGTEWEFDLDKPNLNLYFTKGLNVIIGENDSGKTAIIDAIKLVLKTHSYDYIRVEDKDFYRTSDRLRIELTFDDLTADEAKNFIEWLGWERTEEGAITTFLKINYDVRRQGNKILPSDIRASVDSVGYLLTAEAKEYLKVTYLKPLRDAENELITKRNSRLSQILLGDSAFKDASEEHELVKLFGEMNEKLEKYFKGELEIKSTDDIGRELIIRPQEGKRIKDKIDGYIQGFYGNDHETEFNASLNDIKSILEKLTLSLKDEPNPGLGTLNRLFMAAELLHLNKKNWTGLRLGLVEELEAHLHPQAQMQVVEAFQKQDTIQLILTTHSPNLASKIKLENLIICNNGHTYPIGSDYTKLNSANYKFLEKFLDTTKSNLFFAKGVIFVEGWAEELLVPSIAKNLGINLTEKGVSVVNIGNTAFDHYAKIYLRKVEPFMTIPVAVITDSDIEEYEKSGDNYQKRDEATIKHQSEEKIARINAKSDQYVKYFPAPKWTLEYSLLSSSIKEIFKTAIKHVHSGTPWESDFEKELAKKLLTNKLKKTEIAYYMANAIDEDLASFNKWDIPEKTIQIPINDEADDSINYIVKAIKYASSS